MRILGIDPGTRVVGFGCLELVSGRTAPPGVLRSRNSVAAVHGPGRHRLVEAGVLRLGDSGVPIERRLLDLAEGLDRLIARLGPAVLAVEEAFFGKSVQSALRIGEARGAVLVAAARAGLPVAQYPPATIKLRVAGAGGASKQALARMVEAGLGARDLPLDASDALAVAWCHALSTEGRVRPETPMGG
ncbi:MAG: crossover junction endodeoxyribonuclease RuvC [Planctomycetota bacterium]